MDYLTAKDIIKLEKEGHAICIYPRKYLVSVDGHKMFKINERTKAVYDHYKRTGLPVS